MLPFTFYMTIQYWILNYFVEKFYANEYNNPRNRRAAFNIAFPIIYLAIRFISNCKTINCTTTNLFHVHI